MDKDKGGFAYWLATFRRNRGPAVCWILAVIVLISTFVGFQIDGHMRQKKMLSRHPVEALRTIKSRGVVLSNVIDVGANQCSWSKEIQQFCLPDAKFFLIEGNIGWEPTLKRCGFPYRLTLVGDSEKDVTFYKLCETGACSGGNSVFKEVGEWGPKYKESKEHMVTIDQIVKQEKLGNIDMIKMDIQGAELMALKGATETLKTVKVVLLELSTVPLYPGAPLLAEMIVFMEKIGFKLFSVPDVLNRRGMTISVDALFVRADVHEIWDNPAYLG